VLNCLVGRVEPDTGTVELQGRSLLGRKPHEINPLGISRAFQTPEIFGDLSLLENMMIPALAHCDGAFALNAWASLRGERTLQGRAMDMLAEVGLGELAYTTAAHLSRGDKRRLELAMCLVQEPKLLLLDEPTAGMSRVDTNNTVELLGQINERGITMVVIEHDMRVVFSLAHRISVLAGGAVIAEDVPEQIRGNPRVEEAYLGGAEL